jgi:hypothetical protein
MSRSGYIDDMDDQLQFGRWRGVVASTIRGRRGQAFLKEMLAALDAMPEKKLIAHELETEGAVCAIGAVGVSRGTDMSKLDPEEPEGVAAAFGISTPLAQEIVYMNDEAWYWSEDERGVLRKGEDGKFIKLTPEERFTKMREWVVANIRTDTPNHSSPQRSEK